MPNSLQPHGLQCSRLPCPSLSPKLCLNSRPVILMTPSNHLILCHPLLVPQSFLTSGSFPMSRLFISGGQSTVASASVLPMNLQGWFLFTTTFNLIPLLATSPKEIIMNGLKGSSIKLFLMVWEEKIMEKKKVNIQQPGMVNIYLQSFKSLQRMDYEGQVKIRVHFLLSPLILQ